jgi:hypothetical protein
VNDIQDIMVIHPKDSIYKAKVLPPLFSISFRVTAEDKLLNGTKVEEMSKKIAAWHAANVTANSNANSTKVEKCPHEAIEPIYGKTFEYSNSLNQFKDAILRVFDGIVGNMIIGSPFQKYLTYASHR